MAKVYLPDRDQSARDVDVAIRKLKKIVDRDGLLKLLHERSHYEKPCEWRKRKKAAAVARWRKFLRSQNLPKKMF